MNTLRTNTRIGSGGAYLYTATNYRRASSPQPSPPEEEREKTMQPTASVVNQPWLLLVPAIFLQGGCAHSPTVDVLGSYFPSWMLCIVVGLVSTLIVRLLLIGFGIYSHLRLKPLV